MRNVIVRSGFCCTQNACRFAAIVESGDLRFLDQCPQATYEGPLDGYDTFSLVVPKGSPWLEFIKENGTEMVLVRRAGRSMPVQGFSSFQLARSWVQRRSSQGRGDALRSGVG